MAQKKTQPKQETTDTQKIQLLLQALDLSCNDHCPHHGDRVACVNCEIFKLRKQAGE